jgi:hypothetical protein
MNDAVKTGGGPSPNVGTDVQASVWLALKLGASGVADVMESLVRSPQSVAEHQTTLDRLERLVGLLCRALPGMEAMDRAAGSERLYLIGPEHDELDAPRSEEGKRYKTEWSRRVLQRAGVEAPTAEEVDLLIRRAKVLDDAMLRFRRVACTRNVYLDDANVVLAAAVTAFHEGHAFETGWLQQVSDIIRLEEDLYNDLNPGEEQRRCNAEPEAEVAVHRTVGEGAE